MSPFLSLALSGRKPIVNRSHQGSFGEGMNNIVRIALLLMYGLGLILLCLVFVDKYSWMSEMDPSISAGSVNADTRNSDLTSLVIFIGIMVVQLISVIVEKSRKMKRLAVVLALIAAGVFIARTHYI